MIKKNAGEMLDKNPAQRKKYYQEEIEKLAV